MVRFGSQDRQHSFRYLCRIALLVFNVVWFGAIVPGHTRGMIPVPGSTSDHCSMKADASCAGCENGKTQKHQKSSDNCAVCQFFLRTLPLPGFAILIAPGLEFLRPFDSHVSRFNPPLAFVATYAARGPPVGTPGSSRVTSS